MAATAVGQERVVRRADEHRREIADPGTDREEQGHRSVDDERRAGDDEREREEERAPLPPGERHEQGDEGDRERPLHDEPGRAEEARRQEVVDRQDRQAGDRQDDEDRQLAIGPQARRDDHGGRGEDEQEAGHPDDPLVIRGRNAIHEGPIRILVRCLDQVVRDHRVGRRGIAGHAEAPSAVAHEQSSDDHHQEQVGDDGRDKNRNERHDRHGCPRSGWGRARRPVPGC